MCAAGSAAVPATSDSTTASQASDAVDVAALRLSTCMPTPELPVATEMPPRVREGCGVRRSSRTNTSGMRVAGDRGSDVLAQACAGSAALIPAAADASGVAKGRGLQASPDGQDRPGDRCCSGRARQGGDPTGGCDEGSQQARPSRVRKRSAKAEDACSLEHIDGMLPSGYGSDSEYAPPPSDGSAGDLHTPHLAAPGCSFPTAAARESHLWHTCRVRCCLRMRSHSLTQMFATATVCFRWFGWPSVLLQETHSLSTEAPQAW